MPKPLVPASLAGPPLLDIYSGGRVGPRSSNRLSPPQIEQIRRTVRRTPEVMVKVTGGGRTIGAVAAHLAYISHHGEVELETDEGQRVANEAQRTLVTDWHLELSSGQYRASRRSERRRPTIKLVHNIVLSMPTPTPSDKVLAAAKTFARENFGAKHRYSMALHTHQEHPHVHLVVKAEREDGMGRLRIDKALLREWRQDFAHKMRDQGIAANATSRAARGQTKKGLGDRHYRAKARPNSYAMRDAVTSIAKELSTTHTIRDPARTRLAESRKAVIAGWMSIAAKLDVQGEIVLAGEVRWFAKHLPPALTDRERLAMDFLRHVKTRLPNRPRDDLARAQTLERTR
jgi:hypothetical protein